MGWGRAWAGFVFALTLGCLGSPGGGSPISGGMDGPGGVDGATMVDPPPPGTGSSSDGPAASSGPIYDVDPPDPVEPGPCKKVDFLFVIDSSGSMQTHQENLAASFDGFMDAIQGTLDFAEDFHVMVVDSDENAAASCDWWCDVGSPFCPYTCGSSMDPAIWQECDRSFGAGVRYPLGLGSSSMDCDFPGGRRYLMSGDADLHDKFRCAALVGSSHTDEWQMDALTAAMSPALNGPGGCNEDFLRDDAILVLALITDEPDSLSADLPVDWYDAVVVAKGGNPDAVVMLGLISDRGLPGAVCTNTSGFPAESPNMHEFVDLFPVALKGSICETDYVPFFEDSVALIDSACDSFVPEG